MLPEYTAQTELFNCGYKGAVAAVFAGPCRMYVVNITFLPGGEYISAGIRFSALLCSTGFIKAESKVTVVLVVQRFLHTGETPCSPVPSSVFCCCFGFAF